MRKLTNIGGIGETMGRQSIINIIDFLTGMVDPARRKTIDEMISETSISTSQ